MVQALCCVPLAYRWTLFLLPVFSKLILCQDDLHITSFRLPSHHDQAVGLIQIHFIITQGNQYLSLSRLSAKHCQFSVCPSVGNALLCLENSSFSLFPLSPLLIFKPFISVSISNVIISSAVSSLVSEIRIEEMCCIFKFFERLFGPMKSSCSETIQI